MAQTVETKFTPGPWCVPAGEGNEWLIYTGEPESADTPIAKCDTAFRRFGRIVSHEEHTVNAHLIAAAPELYEAATVALAIIDNEFAGYAPTEPEARAITQLRGALAKARGEA